jgi:hypothetical protein
VDFKKFKNDNVGGNKIFNYRGVGLSRTKLTNLFRDFIRFLDINIGHISTNSNYSNNSNYREIGNKLPPVLNYVKNELKTYDEYHPNPK